MVSMICCDNAGKSLPPNMSERRVWIDEAESLVLAVMPESAVLEMGCLRAGEKSLSSLGRGGENLRKHYEFIGGR